jgi:phospholipid transport system transporter-binding protein
MGSLTIERAGPERLEVKGALTFATAADALRRGQQLLVASQACTVSLAGVDDADTAGLAVLIQWLAIARARAAVLRYEAVPAQILAVAQISDVQDLLTDNGTQKRI